MATTPQWVVLQNSRPMRIEFAHTHLHTTQSLYKYMHIVNYVQTQVQLSLMSSLVFVSLRVAFLCALCKISQFLVA